jgi:hypothetical protein
MKHRILTAALAAFLLLFSLSPAAYAVKDTDPPELTDTPEVTDTPGGELTDTDTPDADEPSGVPFTPSGMGTVIDYANDGAGKVFYTIMTPDEHVFYLVIDREKSADNVYFLNAVTVDDLMALAEPSKNKGSNGGVSAVPDVPTVTPTPSPVPETPMPGQSGGGNMSTLALALAVVLVGGGAGWYFKIYRPKQRRAAGDGAEYEPSADTGDEDWDEAGAFDGDGESGDEE